MNESHGLDVNDRIPRYVQHLKSFQSVEHFSADAFQLVVTQVKSNQTASEKK